MKKRTQLKTALLLAALVNVSYAAEVFFPPAEGTPFKNFPRLQDKLDAQQQQISALKKENQRLLNLVEAQLQQKVAQMNNKMTKLKRYIDNGDGTVTDNRTKLIWLKNANCFDKLDWEKAKQSAVRLRSGQCGLRDGSTAGMWRLPTIYECNTMVNRRYQNPALSNAAETGQWKEGDPFSGVQNHYWSSTSYADGSTNALGVGLYYGYVFSYSKTYSYYVWPVRGGQGQ
jgi:hypothetical protein